MCFRGADLLFGVSDLVIQSGFGFRASVGRDFS